MPRKVARPPDNRQPRLRLVEPPADDDDDLEEQVELFWKAWCIRHSPPKPSEGRHVRFLRELGQALERQLFLPGTGKLRPRQSMPTKADYIIREMVGRDMAVAHAGRKKLAASRRQELDEFLEPQVEALIQREGLRDTEIAKRLSEDELVTEWLEEHKIKRVTREDVGRVRRALGISVWDVRGIRADLD